MAADDPTTDATPLVAHNHGTTDAPLASTASRTPDGNGTPQQHPDRHYEGQREEAAQAHIPGERRARHRRRYRQDDQPAHDHRHQHAAAPRRTALAKEAAETGAEQDPEEHRREAEHRVAQV